MNRHDETKRFETLVMVHLDAAYNLARWLARNEDAAKDIAQEACLRALKFFDTFRGENARPWLLAIVRNAYYDWIARNRSGAEHVPFDEEVHTEFADPERGGHNGYDSLERMLHAKQDPEPQNSEHTPPAHCLGPSDTSLKPLSGQDFIGAGHGDWMNFLAASNDKQPELHICWEIAQPKSEASRPSRSASGRIDAGIPNICFRGDGAAVNAFPVIATSARKWRNLASGQGLVPVERIELPTFGLQNRCSTAELSRRAISGW